MENFAVIERIKALCAARSWTYYRLAKNSDLTYSTLSSMLNNGNMPSIATLERICSGFGITLEQFFATGSDVSSLTEQQRNHLSQWDALTPENQHAVAAFMEFLKDKQSS